MSNVKIALLAVGICILIPLSASALMVATDTTATVAVGEIINENYFAAANAVTIDGTINGDVYAFGNEVIINGTVAGDVIGAAAIFDVNGEVAGNVRVAASTLRLNAPIGKNVTVAGTTITLTDSASVGWSMISGSQTTTINGTIAGNLTTASETVIVNNTIGNNANITLGETGQLTVKSGVEIGGDLFYRGTKSASIDPTAVILGDTTHKQWVHNNREFREALSYGWFFIKLVSLFSILLIGTIVVSAFPKWTHTTTQRMMDNPGTHLLWGILFFIVTPIAAALLLATLIGIPLAVIVFGFYFLALYLSKLFVGIVIGEKLLSIGKRKNTTTLIWTMMLGTFVFVLLTMIPKVGWIFSLVGIIWFLGSLRTLFHEKR